MRGLAKRGARLAIGIGFGKGIELLAGVDDAIDGGNAGHGDLEHAHHGDDAGETDVGDGHAVAVAEGTGLSIAAEPLLHRLEPGGEPMGLPRPPRAVIEVRLGGEIFLDTRGDERVGVRCEHAGNRAHAGSAVGVARQQRGNRVGFLEKLQDGERLRQGPAGWAGATVDQGGNGAQRVDREERCAALLAGIDIDVVFLREDALQIEGDTDSIGR